MRMPYLTIIFILIMMPIIIVFSRYIDVQTKLVNTEIAYDQRLLNSTYDAIKAFQLNSVNTSLYTPETRVKIIEASVDTFFNSIVTAFKYEGNRNNTMKEYIPAIVFTMYDGYYIYSPFTNTLTNVDPDEVDEDYRNDSMIHGLKPYISYTCKYLHKGNIYYITYSMDNYIIVDWFDSSGNHESKEGYLMSGITKNGSKYSYDGIEFNEGDTEALSEYLLMSENSTPIRYYYASIDGTKYYYQGNNTSAPFDVTNCNSNDRIFYIDDSGEAHDQVLKYKNNEERFSFYYNKIFKNNEAYEYYKEAYEFTNWVQTELGDLEVKDIINSVYVSQSSSYKSSDYNDYEFADIGKIFDTSRRKKYSGV